MKISILIPAYNEEKRIPKTLQQIKEYIKNKDHDFEIIVVDDCSTDNTFEVVTNFDIPIKVLKNKKNMGKGYSVKRGMLASQGDFCLFMDADSSTEIRELDKFIPYLKTHEIITGSRALSKDSVVIPQGIIRRNIGTLAHKLIHLILRTKVKDTMCGFKAYNRKAIQTLFSRQLTSGWGFDYEIIFLAEKFKFKIKQVPITWKDDADSKVTIKGYLKSLKELFEIRLNNFLKKYN